MCSRQVHAKYSVYLYARTVESNFDYRILTTAERIEFLDLIDRASLNFIKKVSLLKR